MNRRWLILQRGIIACNSFALIGGLVTLFAAKTKTQVSLSCVMIFSIGISLYLETCRYIAAKKAKS